VILPVTFLHWLPIKKRSRKQNRGVGVKHVILFQSLHLNTAQLIDKTLSNDVLNQGQLCVGNLLIGLHAYIDFIAPHLTAYHPSMTSLAITCHRFSILIPQTLTGFRSILNSELDCFPQYRRHRCVTWSKFGTV